MKLCDRCRVSGCCLNYLGEACKRARKRECPDVVFTNADLIRAMSDEELAKMIYETQKDVCILFAEKLDFPKEEFNFSDDAPDLLNWLRQPAEEA